MSRPLVIIRNSGSWKDGADAIREDLNSRHHQPGNSFPNYTPSDAENTDHATNSAHASHASDGYTIQGNYASDDGGKTWTHIERIVK